MPRYTNKSRVNPVIAAAIIHDDYDRAESDYTVTELIDTPYRVAQLRRPEMENVEVDVGDGLYALFGRSLHHILEEGAKKFEAQRGDGSELRDMYPDHGEMLAEERVFYSTEHSGKPLLLSGQFDLLYKLGDDWILEDHKIVSVDEFKYNRSEKKWEQQLNLLALLLRLNDRTVDEIAINCYYRDWSRAKAHFGKSADYPSAQHLRVQLPLWTLARQQAFLEERLNLHLNHSDVPCTDEERWCKSSGYAIIPFGAPRAVKIVDSKDAAESYIGEKLIKAKKDEDKRKWMLAEIEPRKGTSLRCALYCDAAPICPHWKQLKED